MFLKSLLAQPEHMGFVKLLEFVDCLRQLIMCCLVIFWGIRSLESLPLLFFLYPMATAVTVVCALRLVSEFVFP